MRTWSANCNALSTSACWIEFGSKWIVTRKRTGELGVPKSSVRDRKERDRKEREAQAWFSTSYSMSKIRSNIAGNVGTYLVIIMSPDTPIRTPPFLRNFGGLVLGCIDTSDSESRRIFSGFLRSTRFAFLCTALRSEILGKFRQHFAKFCWIFTNFQSESAFFQPIFMKFHQNFTAISQNFSKFLKLVAIIFKIHEFWRIEGRGGSN